MPNDILFSPNVTTRRRRPKAAVVEKENDWTVNNDKAVERKEIQQAVAAFQLAAEGTCQADFWESKATLAEQVVRASLSLTHSSAKDDTITTPLPEADILNSCRKLIHQATEKKSEKCLLVAVHALCAVVPRLAAVERQEAALKLLYHAITNAAAEPSYVLAAYHAMRVLFQNYTVGVNTKLDVSFEATHLFCVPQYRAFVAAGRRFKQGALQCDQLAAIGLLSTLAAARIMAAETPTATVATDFYVDRRFQQRGAAASLLRDHLPRWISYLALHSKKDATKDILHHLRAAHSIVWELASSSTKNDPEQALQLRQHAIDCLLCTGVDLPESIHEAWIKKYFETTCTNAWKAAVTYAQQATMDAKLLNEFHEQIGRELDSRASRLQHSSPSYVEYSAYRALHVGVLVHKPPTCCDSQQCVFASLGCQYVHGMSASSEESSMLALFFLILRVKEFERNNSKSSSSYLVVADRVVSNFEATIVTGSGSDGQSLQRYFKLLSSASLNRTVYDYFAKAPSSEALLKHRQALEVSCQIFFKCMGLLAFRLVKEGFVDPNKRVFTWEYGVQCFTQAISILEALGLELPKISGDLLLVRSDVLIKDFVATLLETPNLATSCLESTAKVRIIVGPFCVHAFVPYIGLFFSTLEKLEGGDTKLEKIVPCHYFLA
jgi:hypothetical protein